MKQSVVGAIIISLTAATIFEFVVKPMFKNDQGVS